MFNKFGLIKRRFKVKRCKGIHALLYEEDVRVAALAWGLEKAVSEHLICK